MKPGARVTIRDKIYPSLYPVKAEGSESLHSRGGGLAPPPLRKRPERIGIEA